jgi:hypothetical protein
MSEETKVAAPSAAQESTGFTQFDGWDEEGNPVVTKKESPKPAEAGKPEGAESAAADTSKEAKSDEKPEADAGKKTQETRRKPDAEARIRELNARNKQLEQELEEARKPKETKTAESSTAKPEPKAAQPEPTRPKPTKNDKLPDGKAKYPAYEDYVEDLADWKAEQRIAAQQREQQAAQQQQTLGKQLEEARGRYTDFDSVTKPLIQEMLKPEIPREVFAVINDSPVLADLLYTLGGTEATKNDFLEACRTNPGKALRVALLVEQEIAAELGKGKAAAGGGGKAAAATKKDGEGEEGEAKTTPATPKPRAPKPPTEVGGRGAPGEDALISAAKSGDFRSFEAEQTRRVLASRK